MVLSYFAIVSIKRNNNYFFEIWTIIIHVYAILISQSVKKIFIIYIVFVQAFNYKCPLLYFQMLNLIKTKIAFKKLVCI